MLLTKPQWEESVLGMSFAVDEGLEESTEVWRYYFDRLVQVDSARDDVGSFAGGSLAMVEREVNGEGQLELEPEDDEQEEGDVGGQGGGQKTGEHQGKAGVRVSKSKTSTAPDLRRKTETKQFQHDKKRKAGKSGKAGEERESLPSLKQTSQDGSSDSQVSGWGKFNIELDHASYEYRYLMRLRRNITFVLNLKIPDGMSISQPAEVTIMEPPHAARAAEAEESDEESNEVKTQDQKTSEEEATQETQEVTEN